MLDSAPIPLQAILWPLFGAVIVLLARRILPNWLRRMVALLAAAGSLSALWSLRTLGTEKVEFFWDPINLFRTSPSLLPDGLTLLAGVSMGIVTAACVLGIAGSKPQRTIWHGLALITLSGGLIVVMGTNLITLALGSALIDLTLIAMAVSVEEKGKVAWRTVLPGLLSTLMLFGAALRMDTQVGTASLQAQVLPEEVAVVIGIAGLLRLIVLALPPGARRTPEHAGLLILPTVVGLYMLVRIQILAPIHADQSWTLALGGGLLAVGGFMAWTAALPVDRRRQRSGVSERSQANPAPLHPDGAQEGTGRAALAAEATTLPHPEQLSGAERQPGTVTDPKDAGAGAVDELCRGTWPGLSAHQVGLALGSSLLLGGSAPWPMLGLPFTLAILVIWWDANLERQHGPRAGWVDWFVRHLGRAEDRQHADSDAHEATPQRLIGSAWNRAAPNLPAAIALVSLVGVPFTIGAVVRWTFYAALLDLGRAPMLLAALVGDLLLAAALWAYVRTGVRWSADHRVKLPATVGMLFLAVLVVVVGISPDIVTDGWGFQPTESPTVSAWGLGLVYGLPWLLGIWLARSGSELGHYLYPVGRALRLDWLASGTAWLAKRIIDAFHWLGRMGEGEGWWGWALIILALGTIFLTAH